MNKIESMTLNELKIAFYDLTREMDIIAAESAALNQTRNIVAQRINQLIEILENSEIVEDVEPSVLPTVDLHEMDEQVQA